MAKDFYMSNEYAGKSMGLYCLSQISYKFWILVFCMEEIAEKYISKTGSRWSEEISENAPQEVVGKPWIKLWGGIYECIARTWKEACIRAQERHLEEDGEIEINETECDKWWWWWWRRGCFSSKINKSSKMNFINIQPVELDK